MRKILLGILILFIIGLGVYYQLGGFQELMFSIEPRQNITLLGKTYRGTPQDKKMGETFRDMESLIQKNPGTNLHTLYYSEPAGKLDTLKVFVGIEYQEKLDEGKDLEVKTIPCTQAIVVHIEAHRMVMPGPDRVKREIERFAMENGVVTQGIYVDKIIGEGVVEVIAPLKTEKS
jgi:hypothetical protein